MSNQKVFQSVHRDYSQREFPMTEENFEAIQKMAFDYTGIKLTEHKKEMIYGRLARRIRKLGLSSFNDYCDQLGLDDAVEHNDFINVITTNLTSFYRENHHFDFLKKTVVPDLLKKNKVNRKIRIWSAGCSSGEEPYTIASVFLKSMPMQGWDFKILATDLDSDTLQKAKNASYPLDKVKDLEGDKYASLFSKSEKKSADGLQIVKNEVRDLVHFKRLNLMESWPMKGKFDVIFCRNVVIYFTKDTQKVLFDRYADILNPGGYLFIGHSESLNNVSNRFELIGKTTYRLKH